MAFIFGLGFRVRVFGFFFWGGGGGGASLRVHRGLGAIEDERDPAWLRGLGFRARV